MGGDQFRIGAMVMGGLAALAALQAWANGCSAFGSVVLAGLGWAFVMALIFAASAMDGRPGGSTLAIWCGIGGFVAVALLAFEFFDRVALRVCR